MKEQRNSHPPFRLLFHFGQSRQFLEVHKDRYHKFDCKDKNSSDNPSHTIFCIRMYGKDRKSSMNLTENSLDFVESAENETIHWIQHLAFTKS